VVEHVLFKSKSNTKAVCAELTANLKPRLDQGGQRLDQPSISISGESAGGRADDFREAGWRGSQVQVFTEACVGGKIVTCDMWTSDVSGRTSRLVPLVTRSLHHLVAL